MVKQGICFHSNMKDTIDGFHYGVTQTKAGYHGAMDQGRSASAASPTCSTASSP